MSTHSDREERILSFWKEKGIFEKTLEKKAPKGEFTFYDGPPFATGTPHYGHLLAGTMKDVIPRYKTMQGYHVARRWGWDCHGLPVENLIEKELGLKSKKDILDFGIGKFNETARGSVMRYADEWRKVIPRLGRFVDMNHDYRTMDSSYTESVWWIFKNLYDKGLIYEGFKSMNLCPRCETTLSNFEVAQGYRDITDISVYVKFKVNEGAERKAQGESEARGATYLIAWTTTPWTLPGNVALAVNPKIDYVKVHLVATENTPIGSASETYIVAESRLAATFKDKPYEIVEKIHGSDLVGLSYEPLFDYYSRNSSGAGDKGLKNAQNGWKIYAADFVTTEDGTGIVHIAPAFGADDYDLLKKYDLPFVQHVAVDGTFKKEVTDFAGQHVKPKDTPEDKNAHQNADIEVIKWLAHSGKLFEKEKLVHSYPHCWRCETPLINYASSSWFVKVTAIKEKLVKVNKKISWVPEEVGSGRFGNWLEGARDWAISRSRFWGAPIPVWREEGEGRKTQGASELHIIGSLADIKKYSKAKNTYYVMRHGQSEGNVVGTLNGDPQKTNHLTAVGREQVKKSAASIKKFGIDTIVASPFMRTQETAKIVADGLGLRGLGQKISIVTDNRLHERAMGEWEGKLVEDFGKEFHTEDAFTKGPKSGENYSDIRKRIGEFMYDMESKYSGKTILIVTHGGPATVLTAVCRGFSDMETVEYEKDNYLNNAEFRALDFIPLPHNSNYELDLHRPFIDEIELRTENGNKLTRVSDVFDCWFESGAMPWASNHYPFGDIKKFDPRSNVLGGLFRRSRAYPADFIAEGQDQTRGWFYSMLVLGVALFGTSPYKKVLVNGMVLAEDGEKMSKSKQNYPDPMLIVEKYSADALRYYLMSSPVVHSQDLCFSEKGVDEVTKKVINRLLNVVSFYEMYGNEGERRKAQGESGSQSASKNVLDLWIIVRLNETIAQVTAGLEAGELDRAARPFMDLVDDLSTWYLRRSRDRFKAEDLVEKNAALETTKFVLMETAKIMAPFMPFVAEDIYNRVGGGIVAGSLESVHLESWPTADKLTKTDGELLADMKLVRTIASQGLEARMSAKINVRQPLQSLKVKSLKDKKQGVLTKDLISIIADEVNVKEVIFEAQDTVGLSVELDVTMTAELKEEGMVRELIRAIQDLRKEKGLTIDDKATIVVETDEVGHKFIEKNKDTISRATLLKGIEWGSVAGENVSGEALKIGDIAMKIKLN
ncbi:MAG: class I tRNA ligase family protein [Candidatus Taylorbacteria bacterium]